jgi:tyrosyl-tRNA synthetase
MDRILIPPADEQLALLERGAVDLEVKEELLARLKSSHDKQVPLKIKAGFDPTAPDLHLGHTVLMEKMAQFQRLGHEVIFVVGDYTALIGDPTGRNTMRPPLTEEEITRNATTYTDQVFKMLDRARTRIVRNSEWLGKLSFRDVVLLAAKYNVGRMLERRDFKERFESGRQIAVHEFLYPLMQGYDSVELRADVELGGHDQIFNLLVGRHLMEHYGQRPQCVLTVGLLVGLDGVEKMSKSKGNHIGITETPDDMFGKAMSISDDTMWGWYGLLSDRSPDRTQPLDAKKMLAHLLIERFHGKAAADSSLEWWNAGRPLRDDAGEAEVEAAPLKALLVKLALAESNADAFRKIKEGAVTIEGEKHADPAEVLAPGAYLLRVGKKHQKRIRIVPPKT